MEVLVISFLRFFETELQFYFYKNLVCKTVIRIGSWCISSLVVIVVEALEKKHLQNSTPIEYTYVIVYIIKSWPIIKKKWVVLILHHYKLKQLIPHKNNTNKLQKNTNKKQWKLLLKTKRKPRAQKTKEKKGHRRISR